MTKKKNKKPQPTEAAPVAAASHHPFERYVVALVFISIAVVYGFTLKRSVEGGDSGEMIIAAYTMGIAHPPGYPLYTLLGKVFSFLPFGTVAFKLNMFSAICNWLACLFLYFSTTLLFKRISLALLAVVVFAFYPYVWRYSLVAEVFSLNNLIASILIWLFIDQILNRKDLRNLYLGALTIGLGMSHHHTIIFIALPFVVSLMVHEGKTLLNLKVMAKLV